MVLRATAELSKPLQKSETGIAGLDVQPAAREILIRLYELVVAKVQEMEPEAPYRIHMERIMNYRLDILRTTESVLEIESKIEDGQIEEMIEEAEDELEMLPTFIESKMWQAPKWHSVPIIWSKMQD